MYGRQLIVVTDLHQCSTEKRDDAVSIRFSVDVLFVKLEHCVQYFRVEFRQVQCSYRDTLMGQLTPFPPYFVASTAFKGAQVIIEGLVALVLPMKLQPDEKGG